MGVVLQRLIPGQQNSVVVTGGGDDHLIHWIAVEWLRERKTTPVSWYFDLKLLLCAFLIAFWYRWKRDWNGRVPRKLMRFGARQSQRAIS